VRTAIEIAVTRTKDAHTVKDDDSE
jgi:hypothetical protein